MDKPQLADVMPLPVHPTWRHPITGAPIRALGYTRNGRAIWPVMGGSQPLGGPAPGAVQQPQQQPGGQPAVPLVPVLGGPPVPVMAPGAQVPLAQPAYAQPVYGQPPYAQPVYGQPAQQPVPVPVFGQTLGGAPVQQVPVQQPYAPPAGVMPWQAGQQFPGQAVPPPPGAGPFMMPAAPANGSPVNGQPQAGQPGQQAGQPGQQAGQQPQGGGQQTGGTDGPWDKPYPQGVPLDQMTPDQQVSFWKYHNRKLEDRLRSQADYDQLKQQLGQLQAMTQTEWQRAVMEAEARGRTAAMQQAAGQMVAVAFQGAAQHRMTPDQIQAQLGVLDPNRFVHNGQVDIAAIQAYVDTIAPQRQHGLVPVFPAQPGQLPLQQVPVGQPGQPLQPGQPGYGQQPTFGPLGGQQPYGQPGVPALGQPAGGPFAGQVAMPGQPGYGQVPIPGVPAPYQSAASPAMPVVQAAGLHGLPGLPAAGDFGQGPAIQQAPANAAQAGAAVAAARHGKTRSQQLADTRG